MDWNHVHFPLLLVSRIRSKKQDNFVSVRKSFPPASVTKSRTVREGKTTRNDLQSLVKKLVTRAILQTQVPETASDRHWLETSEEHESKKKMKESLTLFSWIHRRVCWTTETVFGFCWFKFLPSNISGEEKRRYMNSKFTGFSSYTPMFPYAVQTRLKMWGQGLWLSVNSLSWKKGSDDEKEDRNNQEKIPRMNQETETKVNHVSSDKITMIVRHDMRKECNIKNSFGSLSFSLIKKVEETRV